ncbi:membrane primary amine oxidase-like [Heteronotia binoei]|uniref:membrane primary amine oxidase-like n=1 Tax=Heteronotia binoei TaxID=13085 RepID=UPI00292F2224|nr:membrane primary amine oxidase-like [Heteronotia binoei]
MNMRLVCVLLAICTAMALILGWIFRTRQEKPPVCESQQQDLCLKDRGQDGQSFIFADLTPEEMVQVKKYLWKNLAAPLVEPARAKPSDNCIYSIVLHLPPKAEVLEFLDRYGRKPTREALAVVHFGYQEDPNITEYVVGPLPKPRYHQDITIQKYGGKLPYHRRFFMGSERREINILLSKEYLKAPDFMLRVLDYNGSNLVKLLAVPPGFKSGDRKVWMGHFQNVSGVCLHPVGLELQVDVRSLNVSEWKVLNVFYNGQYFRDMEDLERQFNEGKVKVAKVKKAPRDGGYSSLKSRAPPELPGPLQYEPRGPRYCIRDNQVTFMSWSFAFGMEVNRGPRIFDVRFEGKRIVYELSVQDASALYGSNSPGMMLTRYMDLAYGLGKGAFTLIRGVDCPYLATFLDAHYFHDSSQPIAHKNSICIFEQNTEVPVRRHYEHLLSAFYGALADSALVFRSISVMGNYDYIWDFIFHQNGAVGVRVFASGYVQTSFFFNDAADFGNRIQEFTLGTMHTHNIHYKVDLDVGGVKNSLMTNDMNFTKAKAPWDPEQEIHQMKLKRKRLETENEAAFRLRDNVPRNIHFTANSTNRWGHDRGYRIQIYSFSGEHLPESDPMERAISWGRYKLAVTKRKEEEPFSTSVYNQNDPWTPSVAFEDFINNETITNEDLVAWITVGFLHIPHAEDIPNTATLGNAVGFMLRPYNFYDDDPSMYSPDSVFFTNKQDLTSCAINHLACLGKVASCLPNFPAFSYEGFQNLTGL